MLVSGVSYSVPFCLQMEVLGPLEAKRFKEQYKTMATALDTM